MSVKQQKKGKVIRNKSIKQMVFSGKNYMLFGVAILLLATGFGGMYVENNFTGWFSLYISPILAVAGFITVALAILYREQTETE